jgi:nucleoside-diphosphate-sugar epimerase
MKVFVTGGTGFIGARLTEKLIEDNHEVILLARSPSMVPYAGNEKVTVIKGDLSDKEKLKTGMKSCDWVFHMAAYAKASFSDPSVVTSINIDGTVNVFEAALESGVRKVVFTSTGGTMSYSHDGMPVDEETNKNPELHTLYEKTKAEAEKIAVGYKAKGLDVVIVNPTRVYGPGRLSESNSVTRIIKLYMSGLWRINPGDGSSTGNYVYVDDVAEGHILAAMHGRGGERYILGGENLSFNRLFDTIGSAAGRKRILIRLPAGLMKAIVKGITFFSRIFKVSPPITRDFLDKYLRDWIMSSDKAVRELGYRITPLSEGVAKTIEWLRTIDDGKGN